MSAITASFGHTQLEVKSSPVSGTASPEAWFVDLLGGSATSSKVRVNARSAMSVPAVCRAVNLISGTIGVLPCRVLKVDEKGETPATDHPAHSLVARRANPWTAANAFRVQLTRDMLLHGDGFGLVVRVAGRPIELHRLAPGTVTVALDEITGEPLYSATIKGAVIPLDWRDVIHVAAPSIDGVSGASPIHLGREAIGLSLTLEHHAARLFGNGARPGGVISVPGTLGDTAAPRMKASWQSAFGGEGSGGTAVLEGGASFSPITLSAVDTQFLELRQHQIREVANLFGVPPTMLGDLAQATFSNAESLGQAFRDECLLPIVNAWEAALERVLLTDEEFANFRVSLDTDALDRADLTAKSEAMAKRRAAGLTTANEERRALNLPARPDGEALGSPFTTANAGQATNEEAPATNV